MRVTCRQSQDHAVLVFSDIRSGGDLDVYAYRVGPNQEQVWGPDGVTISDNADFDLDPMVVETGAGHFVINWPRLPDAGDGKLMMQRVNFDGSLVMAPGGVEIAGDPSADFNGDGTVNTLDFLAFLNAYNAGCG